MSHGIRPRWSLVASVSVAISACSPASLGGALAATSAEGESERQAAAISIVTGPPTRVFASLTHRSSIPRPTGHRLGALTSRPRERRSRTRLCVVSEGGIEGLPARLTQATIHELILRFFGFIFECELVARVLTLDERVPAERTRASRGLGVLSSRVVIGRISHRIATYARVGIETHG